MTLREYQLAAARTCPDLGGQEANLLHMKLGVITEFGEFLDMIKKHIAYGKPLDYVNLQEEIADIIWYLANEMRIQDISLNGVELITKHFMFKENLDKVSHDMSKILVTYIMNAGMIRSASYFSLISDLHMISAKLHLDFYKGLENNINKLKIRFPEKFTQEHALNRDLDSERKELEK
jgi:NTP pyrophosphatase (non-canonical NTP hydrolase)